MKWSGSGQPIEAVLDAAFIDAARFEIHPVNSALSVDFQVDDMNNYLCDDFRFSQFNTANTNLLFALGTGETHDAPDFENPTDDMGGERRISLWHRGPRCN